MADDENDGIDTARALDALQTALGLQARSIVAMTHLAGAMRGLGGVAVKAQLRDFVAAEVEDTYLLVEKFSALGGQMTISVEAFEVLTDTGAAIGVLLDQEREAVAALHRVIPHSGQQPESEALEHLLEHTIMRKQQQIDFLWHATDRDPIT